MARFGSKGSLGDFLFNKFTLIVVLIMCGYGAVSVYERYSVEREMSSRSKQTEIEYQTLEERQKTLLERVEYLKGDGGIESEIRKNFDVAREGEQVVIIVDDEEGTEIKFTEGISPGVKGEEPWYKFW